MNPGEGLALGTLFLTGLAGSLHCVGMCGPILIAFSRVLEGPRRSFGSLGFFSYHAGRLWTYALLGLLAGWAGMELRHSTAWLGWQRSFGVAVAVLVIASGLLGLGVIPGLRFDLQAASCALPERRFPPGGNKGGKHWLDALMRAPGLGGRLLLGAVMGLLPCGLVYSMLLVVSSFPTPVHSALGMLCFGLGTIPALSAVVLGSRVAPLWMRTHGTRIAAVLLIGIGVFMLWRATQGGMHHHGMGTGH